MPGNSTGRELGPEETGEQEMGSGCSAQETVNWQWPFEHRQTSLLELGVSG
jgi:hypothetical protein